MVQATGPLQSRVHSKLVDNDGNLISDAKLSDILAALLDLDTTVTREPLHLNSTGTGTTLRTLAPGAAYRLLGFRAHMGGALQAGEDLVVTFDSGVGGAYDTVLFTLDMGTPDIRDIVIPFGGEDDFYQAADAVVVTLSANANVITWGCETIYELV